jgi:hypothetical protein
VWCGLHRDGVGPNNVPSSRAKKKQFAVFQLVHDGTHPIGRHAQHAGDVIRPHGLGESWQLAHNKMVYQTLLVVEATRGADTIEQLEENVAFARTLRAMTPDEQEALIRAVSPYARDLMYYKP